MDDSRFIDLTQKLHRICLVGAGNIAQIHAEVVHGLPGCRLTAIVDPDNAAARRLAQRFGVPHIFASVAEALEADVFDRAHVLVPPPVHADAAQPILAAGKAVLVEKPVADSSAASRMLTDISAQSGAALGTNQNFLHHPSFLKLQRLLLARALGRPNSISCIYNMPLRQLAGRQFGHWMFRAPVNILLEQAVHPLSQLVAVAGRVTDVRAFSGKPVTIADGHSFFPDLDIALKCERLPAQMRFAVGQRFPVWHLTVVCDDGVVVADITGNRLFTYGRSRYSEPINGMVSAFATGASIGAGGVKNAADYALALFRLRPKSDPFFVSMRDSIAAFHQSVGAPAAILSDGEFGAHLVSVCERIGETAFPAVTPAEVLPARPCSATAPPPAAAIIGGTGFIGRYVVKRFLDAGMSVTVMARSVEGLPTLFSDPRIHLCRGDVGDAAAVAEAVGDCPIVINLAHGGGAAQTRLIDRMVQGAVTVAQVSLEKGVRRLIHVGSIAALYLGPQREPVNGATPPDPEARHRAEYARAKAQCDRLLLKLHAEKGLPICIVRPGLVVGEGGEAFHSGVGNFNNEQHCIGWNAGRNPLPFVLVEDVAEAIFLASRAEAIDGRCYNLIGDIRINAREYISELARVLERPLHFHGKTATGNWLQDVGKWLVKRCSGRVAPWPARRDLVSRGLRADFDCGDAKRDLGWSPTADKEVFLRRAVLVHAA